mmetsp:Transcript_18371/g.21753  ORF Transcript_18371/g.21753 Transcript_18371/m.21753 type:complete len:87 (+) Transcript_18371:1-261(+)
MHRKMPNKEEAHNFQTSYRQTRKNVLNGVWLRISDTMIRRRIVIAFCLCFLIIIYLLHRDYAWHLILLQGMITPERSTCEFRNDNS